MNELERKTQHVKKISEMTEKIKSIDLSDNSRTILERRYLRKSPDGKAVETIEDMFERIAKTVAEPDAPYRDVYETKVEFYNLMCTKRFFPNSPTFTGAGTPLGQLAACFVLPVADDMGSHPDGIFSTLKNAALIQKSGGGNGFSFSDLRAKGATVSTSGGVASGPVGFLRVYDAAFGEVAQGGIRRGANMAVLRVDHPDIRDFIKCKSMEGTISNFNISVVVTDTFMQAVSEDRTYDLVDPHTKQVVESPKAREIFDLIVHFAHLNGEPGVLFVDTANKSNPVPHLYELKATNPCGEQWLGPYENCCLGSVNLAEHINEDGKIMWGLLQETIEISTRFLDNVVSANKYVPEVPQLKEAATNVRRIGLGIMGLADAMFSAGVRYGDKRGQEFGAQLMEFVRFHAMKTSIELAKERGPFPQIIGSIYDPDNMKWQAPKPLRPFEHDFDRPELNWNEVVEGIRTYGIRNGAQTTIAPTGTISTVAGVEGYGCEPAFALAYFRNVYQAAGSEQKLTLTYVSPQFTNALDKAGIIGEERQRIIDQVVESGSCKSLEGVPSEIADIFVVSADITPEEHILMQASLQAFVDNSISKTCNFPQDTSEENVAKVYMMGWELGCKGLTVYVTGSRSEVVLETKETKDKKGSSAVIQDIPYKLPSRPYKLSGTTYKVQTPQGKAFVTINKDSEGKPLEVFINVGKAGTDVAALSEALGRLTSGWLRASRKPMETVKEIIVQMVGIGGAKSVGFGKSRVCSIPDAVAKVLAEEFDIKVRSNGSNSIEENKKEVSVFSSSDVCPDCGNATFIQEEGCKKCYTCGYSVC